MAPAGTGQGIYVAAEEGDVAALRPLLQQWSGHDVLNWANPDDYERTPLIIGSKEGKLEAVQLLLATPGERDAVLPPLYNRLLVTIYTHPPPSLSLFFSPGIDVNKTGNNGWTAVMNAVYNGRTEVVRALLAIRGIDLNKRATAECAKGRTALGIAIEFNKPEAAALLRAAEAEE